MPGCSVLVQLDARLAGLWLPAASVDCTSRLHWPALQTPVRPYQTSPAVVHTSRHVVFSVVGVLGALHWKVWSWEPV